MTATGLKDFFSAEFGNLILLLVFMAGSAFFSCSETAFFNLSGAQLYRMRTGERAGRIVASLMARPRRLLNTILLGNMIVSVAYAGISAMLAISLRHSGAPNWAVAVTSVGPLLVLILLAEVAPKMLAVTAGPGIALLAGPILAVVQRVLWPLLLVMDRFIIWPFTRILAPGRPKKTDITAEELSALLDLSAKRGIIDRDANILLQEIVTLTDLRVGDIMVPRVDMSAYDVDEGPAGLVEMFAATRLQRIPVYERDIDHVLGVVHAKRLLLDRDVPLRQLVTKIPFVPEAASVERLLVLFRVMRAQAAIVVDEYGGTAGMVTLDRVLEEIVGDIPDSQDFSRGPAVEHLGGNEYLVDGNLSIHEWADAFKIDLSGERISTVGGFVVSLIGSIPKVGDQAVYRNLQFTVESVRRQRIEKLRLRLMGGSP